MQITAGALTGRFGKRPRYWGERMLDEGIAHLLVTDSHRRGTARAAARRSARCAALRVGEPERCAS